MHHGHSTVQEETAMRTIANPDEQLARDAARYGDV
jgi:hypothetical protein